MKQVKLHNVSAEEVKTLQNEIYDFQQQAEKSLKTTENFLDAIITLDIAFRLWFTFRTKIETPEAKKGYKITFKTSEAAVLLKVCYFQNPNSGVFEKNVKEKYKLFLDQQLKGMLL
jgi:hypothetical protein